MSFTVFEPTTKDTAILGALRLLESNIFQTSKITPTKQITIAERELATALKVKQPIFIKGDKLKSNITFKCSKHSCVINYH